MNSHAKLRGIEGMLEVVSIPGKARGCSTFIIHSPSEPFPPIALWRRPAQTVRDSSSSYKIDYVIVIKTFLNPEGHKNRISGSNVLLKGWILPIAGSSSVEGLRSTGLPCLVLIILGDGLQILRPLLRHLFGHKPL